MNNKIITGVIAVILVGSGSFYAGMKYDQGKTGATLGGNGQTRNQQFGGMGGGGGRGVRANGGFSSGEILSKDDKSITLKLRDGGSKIIFLSTSTQIMKATEGALKDLNVGEEVTATGSTNADGSITAQSVQVRPPVKAGQ